MSEEPCHRELAGVEVDVGAAGSPVLVSAIAPGGSAASRSAGRRRSSAAGWCSGRPCRSRSVVAVAVASSSSRASSRPWRVRRRAPCASAARSHLERVIVGGVAERLDLAEQPVERRPTCPARSSGRRSPGPGCRSCPRTRRVDLGVPDVLLDRVVLQESGAAEGLQASVSISYARSEPTPLTIGSSRSLTLIAARLLATVPTAGTVDPAGGVEVRPRAGLPRTPSAASASGARRDARSMVTRGAALSVARVRSGPCTRMCA